MTDRAKKLNREEKLQLQAEKLKEQAQIDLEGYVMCRSALRATRTDLHEESEPVSYTHLTLPTIA